LELDLSAAGADFDLVAKAKPSLRQCLHVRRKIRHLQHHTVPSTRLLCSAAWQRSRTRSARTAEKNREITERDRSECRELLVSGLEPEVFGVESDSAGDIGDLVTNSVKA